MADRVLQRHDTAARWQQYNPVLAEGEIGIITDGAKGYKIGDGKTPWNSLPFPANPANVVQETGDSESAVMSQKAVSGKLGELADRASAIEATPNLAAGISSGYINIDDVNKEIQVNGNIFIKDIIIPSGSTKYDFSNITTNYIYLVYDLTNHDIKLVSFRDLALNHLTLATLYADNAKNIILKVVSSSIECKLNGISESTQIEFLLKESSECYKAVGCAGYINIDTLSSNSVDKITLSDIVRVPSATQPYYITIDSGTYDVVKPVGTFGALCYNLQTSAFEYVDIRYYEKHHIILASYNKFNDFKIDFSVIECRVNGINIKTNVDFSFANTLKPVYSAGYININTSYTDNFHLVTLTDRVRIRLEGSPYYRDIVAGEYEVTKPSGSFVALVYNLDTSQICYIDSRYVEKQNVIIATFSNENPKYFSLTHSVIDCRINGVSDKTVLRELQDRINNEIEPTKAIKASAWEASVKSREQYLRFKHKDSGESEKWYGVEWKEERNADNVVAIGDSNLHMSLPIQSRMKRCITKNGVVQYYLHEDNSELKADGTSANLDGTDGNVMVEIPEFFYRIESEYVDGVRIIRIKLSEQGLDGFVFSPQRYTSAYEATLNHETGVLASVCTTLYNRELEEVKIKTSTNYTVGTGHSLGVQRTAERIGFTDNAFKYRGGTNNSSYDDETDTSSQNYSRNQLGLPISYVTREQCRSYTDIENGILLYQYDTQKILYLLCQVEYKNRNIQEALGYGATRYPSYEAYEAYWNKGVVDSGQNGISCIPCGVTNSLGNSSGEVYYRMINVPIDAEGAKETAVLTEWGDVWMPCMSYRGVEHFWGHIYKIVDQLNIYMGNRVGYVPDHDGDIYYGIYPVTYYYEKNPFLTNNLRDEKKKLGTWNVAANICTINSILMDDNAHIVPIGSDTKDYDENYCDCVEITKTNELLYASYNGRLVSDKLVGLNFIFAQKAVDEMSQVNARPSDGTRIDHF